MVLSISKTTIANVAALPAWLLGWMVQTNILLLVHVYARSADSAYTGSPYTVRTYLYTQVVVVPFVDARSRSDIFYSLVFDLFCSVNFAAAIAASGYNSNWLLPAVTFLDIEYWGKLNNNAFHQLNDQQLLCLSVPFLPRLLWPRRNNFSTIFTVLINTDSHFVRSIRVFIPSHGTLQVYIHF